jgi:hypothetical protein
MNTRKKTLHKKAKMTETGCSAGVERALSVNVAEIGRDKASG